MDTRANFQRLLDDMDAVIRRKQQEMSELDERLETAREQLSEREAKELLSQQEATDVATGESNLVQQDIDDLMQKQRAHYEQQITNLNFELIELESANQGLTKSNGQLRFEVDSLKVSNEKLRDRLQMLNESLEEVQSANFELNIRLAKAESESHMQQKLLKKSHEQDQILMDAFNDKLESLKEAIASRDDEIRRLHVDNQLALESLGIEVEFDDKNDDIDGARLEKDEQLSSNYPASDDMVEQNMRDTKKHGLARIANLIRGRDAQIEELRNQLVQATRELQNSANLFETINKEKTSDTDDRETGLAKRTQGDDNKNELLARCKMLECELNDKDKHLHLISKRNRHLEKILPYEITQLIENLRSSGRAVICLDGGVADDSIETERNSATISKLADGLSELLNAINSTQTLLDTVDQLQRVVMSRDAQIKRLVRELNELNARINQDQIDVPPASPEGTDGTPLSVSGETRPEHDAANDREEQSADFLITDQDDEPTVLGEGQMLVAKSEKEEDGDSANSEKQETEASTGQASESVVAVSTKEATPLNNPKQEASPLELIENALTTTRNQDRIRLNFGSGRTGRSKKHSLFGYRQVGRKRTCLYSTAKLTIDFKKRKRTGATAHDLIKGNNNNEQRQEQQAFNYRDRLRQLESENQLLELAMKEILMSIKWSDSRCSTILIDCPSLERLCQLLEARYSATNGCGSRLQSCKMYSVDGTEELSVERPASGEPSRERESKSESNLFQLIMMKSELDLLRSQNEKLKSDMRLQRYDRQAVSRPHSPDDEQEEIQAKDDRPKSGSGCVANSVRTEAECQTDSLILVDPNRIFLDQQAIVDKGSASENMHELSTKVEKCRNCPRLVNLSNHLLDCILRIESRVNSSNESYINRLMKLYQLSQQLSQDLSMRDNLINQLRRDNQRVSQQKFIIESRLNTVETQLKVHNSTCPLHSRAANVNQRDTVVIESPSNQKPPTDVQWYSATRNGSSQSIHSLTIRSSQKLVEVPLKDSRIAISLLQSIIACLQARLDHKDDRLNQLEQLLIAN